MTVTLSTSSGFSEPGTNAFHSNPSRPPNLSHQQGLPTGIEIGLDRLIFPPSPPLADDFAMKIANTTEGQTARQQQPESDEPVVPIVYRSPRPARRAMWSIATWEGVVDEVKRDHFIARVTEVRHGNPVTDEDEVTEFDLGDLEFESDRKLVQPGAVFYWTLGRARNDAGSIARVSVVRFRRLPVLSGLSKVQADEEAENLANDLGFPQS
jgi:hypothetical protein